MSVVMARRSRPPPLWPGAPTLLHTPQLELLRLHARGLLGARLHESAAHAALVASAKARGSKDAAAL